MPTLTVNGLDLFYEEAGTGAPILCIHGTGGSTMTWSSAVDILATRGRVITYERRGSGRSQRPEPFEVIHVEDHVSDAAGILESLGASPAVIIGRSYGGSVALQLAASRPELVTALALLEPPVEGLDPETDQWHSSWRADLDAVSGGAEGVADRFMRAAVGDQAWESMPSQWRQIFFANGPAILAEARGGVQVDMDAAAAVSVPTLVVIAEDSPPAMQTAGRVIADLLPHARLELVPGGHIIDPASPAILSFLNTLTS